MSTITPLNNQPAAGATGAARPAAPTAPAAAKPRTAEPATAPPPSEAQVAEAVANLRKVVEPVAQNLQFTVDDESGRTVIKVVDKATNEVLRQIPSEEALAISHALDKLQGLLLRQEA